MRADQDMDTRQISLQQVAARCTEETIEYWRGRPSDARYCFELFRRAIDDGNQDAWTYLVEQYGHVVLGWVRRHPNRAAVGDDDEYWVNDAFRRFWQATRSKQLKDFHSLSGLLAFLKTCVHGAVMDGLRRRSPVPVDPLPGPGGENNQEPRVTSPEPWLGVELWEAVKQALPDERERLVVYLRLCVGLSPREIPRREPERFASVEDVYRVYRHALDRLRHEDDFRQFFE